MKRIICLALVLCALVCCLSSCAVAEGLLVGLFTAGTSDIDGNVENMITALSEGRESDALALMHTSVRAGCEENLKTLVDFIDGRKIDSIKQTGYYINTQVGIGGAVVQEQITYDVLFTDGTAIGVNAIYLTNVADQGFYRFVVGAPTAPESENDNGSENGDAI